MLALRPLLSVERPSDAIGRIPPELLELAEVMEPWTSYLAFTDDNIAVGACTFKAPPNEKHEVEIAYFTFSEFENRGFGAAMAGLLYSLAAGSGQVERVIAHTLPEENSSVRICPAIGLRING
jgi:ribosomal-protein-alanine N-acetyltransferase